MERRAIEKIDNYETQLYLLLSDELAAGPRRISFDHLARRLGCARSTVTYNVGKLISAGLIGIEDRKLVLR